MTKLFTSALLLTLLPLVASTCASFNSDHDATCTLGNRTYLLHKPANYLSSTAHALVLSFHGRNGSPAVQEKLSQFSEVGNLINSRGIVAAYPLGLEGDGGETSWQGAPYAVTGVDDIGFALDIVTEVSALLNIDSSRVYAAGKSNGGGFVNLLACNKTSAAVFAAFAPVSAALYPDTLSMTGCDPGRSIPIINSHGTADATVPYTGKTSSSTDRSEPDIQTWREAWATRNECTSKTPTSTTKPFKNATEYEWACSGATVVGVTVEGLGHSWPTTLGLDPSGSPENVASFNMTSAFILPFFEAHTL